MRERGPQMKSRMTAGDTLNLLMHYVSTASIQRPLTSRSQEAAYRPDHTDLRAERIRVRRRGCKAGSAPVT